MTANMGAGSTCPNMHGLLALEAPHGAFTCDGCREAMSEGAWLAGCRQCNYDLCVKCHTAGAATVINAVPNRTDAMDQELLRIGHRYHLQPKLTDVGNWEWIHKPLTTGTGQRRQASHEAPAADASESSSADASESSSAVLTSSKFRDDIHSAECHRRLRHDVDVLMQCASEGSFILRERPPKDQHALALCLRALCLETMATIPPSLVHPSLHDEALIDVMCVCDSNPLCRCTASRARDAKQISDNLPFEQYHLSVFHRDQDQGSGAGAVHQFVLQKGNRAHPRHWVLTPLRPVNHTLPMVLARHTATGRTNSVARMIQDMMQSRQLPVPCRLNYAMPVAGHTSRGVSAARMVAQAWAEDASGSALVPATTEASDREPSARSEPSGCTLYLFMQLLRDYEPGIVEMVQACVVTRKLLHGEETMHYTIAPPFQKGAKKRPLSGFEMCFASSTPYVPGAGCRVQNTSRIQS